ncbi:MAG: polysaccharide biosynthesis tyrosine autokinase [Bacteroidales bacterium]|nr:polysaccharide biosynthesis tyrosine autokinase [Bacteroidales bacterium]
MKNNGDFKQDIKHFLPQEADGNDIQFILSLILKNWYWFIIATVLALFLARWYVGHTLPVYRTSATLLINEADDRSLGGNAELLQGLGLPGGMKNLQNQIMIIQSRGLTERTLEKLSFETEYYFKTIRNRLPIYPEVPLKIISEGPIPLPKDTEFSIDYLGNNMFILTSESKRYPFQKSALFGETIDMKGGSFIIECRDEEWLKLNKERILCFKIHSKVSLVNYFVGRINVEQISRDGTVVRISMNGTNRYKDTDFLNMLVEGFYSISLDKKNAEAQRRIQFIDDQLIGISDSLITTENRLQQFRSVNRVMDLSAQGQAIIAQVTLHENNRARLNLEANYYDYLADYINKDVSGEIPMVPITMGIADPGLTRLVEELAELQGQLTMKGAGEMNPLQRNLEQRVRTSKEALRETLNGLRRANSLARSENQEQINKANSQAAALPVTERQLLGIERKFRLNDELYTFLLETRAEQEMQRASNRADCEVIDYADAQFSARISPNEMRLNIIGIFMGLVVPFVIIYLILLFSKTLKEEDIRKMTYLPVVGNIPHNTEKTNRVVFDNPNSSLSESFRLLRSRMQFFTKEAKAPVILIMSTMPEEGKTFTAVNLASVYSLLGKRTILVGYDLRKPKLVNDFNLSNEKGVTTWLIGKDNLSDIIQETSFENLSVITAGPVPPNPSELIALDKSRELIKLLKEKYEYIIIDTAPLGIVSDTFHLISLADVSILVVRPGRTSRDVFGRTLNEIGESGTQGVSLVINDIPSTSKHYGYKEKHGYTKSKDKGKILSKKRFILSAKHKSAE